MAGRGAAGREVSSTKLIDYRGDVRPPSNASPPYTVGCPPPPPPAALQCVPPSSLCPPLLGRRVDVAAEGAGSKQAVAGEVAAWRALRLRRLLPAGATEQASAMLHGVAAGEAAPLLAAAPQGEAVASPLPGVASPLLPAPRSSRSSRCSSAAPAGGVVAAAMLAARGLVSARLQHSWAAGQGLQEASCLVAAPRRWPLTETRRGASGRWGCSLDCLAAEQSRFMSARA